jgi:hypothetical protein
LVGRVAGKGSELFLNDSQANENVTEACYRRVVLPVTQGPAEPLFFAPPAP